MAYSPFCPLTPELYKSFCSFSLYFAYLFDLLAFLFITVVSEISKFSFLLLDLAFILCFIAVLLSILYPQIYKLLDDVETVFWLLFSVQQNTIHIAVAQKMIL